MLAITPAIDRIAWVLDEPATDLLTTFANASRRSEPIGNEALSLARSGSVEALAQGGGVRVTHGIAGIVSGATEPARWLRRRGYRSSLTVPDARQRRVHRLDPLPLPEERRFLNSLQRDVEHFHGLGNSTNSSAYADLRSIRASATSGERTELPCLGAPLPLHANTAEFVDFSIPTGGTILAWDLDTLRQDGRVAPVRQATPCVLFPTPTPVGPSRCNG